MYSSRRGRLLSAPKTTTRVKDHQKGVATKAATPFFRISIMLLRALLTPIPRRIRKASCAYPDAEQP